MKRSTPPVAKLPRSAAVAWPSGEASAAWIAASESNVSVAIRWYGDAPPEHRDVPARHLVVAQPGIFLAIGTCVA